MSQTLERILKVATCMGVAPSHRTTADNVSDCKGGEPADAKWTEPAAAPGIDSSQR